MATARSTDFDCSFVPGPLGYGISYLKHWLLIADDTRFVSNPMIYVYDIGGDGSGHRLGVIPTFLHSVIDIVKKYRFGCKTTIPASNQKIFMYKSLKCIQSFGIACTSRRAINWAVNPAVRRRIKCFTSELQFLYARELADLLDKCFCQGT